MKRICVICIMILMGLFMCGCAGNTENDNNDAPVPEHETKAPADGDISGMLPVNETGDGVKVADLMEARAFIGLTAREAGIPESVIAASEGMGKTYVDGRVFGEEDYAVIYFGADADGGPETVESVWLHVKNTPFEKCREELSALFGEPYDEGEEPYAEANGGAVMWARFSDGDTEVLLSGASERTYTEIEFSKTAK